MAKSSHKQPDDRGQPQDGREKSEAMLKALKVKKAGPPPSDTLPDPNDIIACEAPDVRTPPQFVVPFRRFLPETPVPLIPSAAPQFACVVAPASGLACSLGFDLRFEQTWNLRRVAIADLSSTIALAPRESLTLEFQTTQRRVLEQVTVDSAEEQREIASTILDKEVMSTTRSSSKNNNWHVDGSGSFSLGPVGSLSIGAGISESIALTAQSSVEHVSESTKKSSQNLKTLHKVEVRGVSETVISNRMTRFIENPYKDRTLTINVFQLLKHFSVGTALVETKPVFTIKVDTLIFDEEFVASNAGFLSEHLLDEEIVDDLANAQEATSVLITTAGTAAREAAEMALHYFYEDVNIFDVKTVAGFDGNKPSVSFGAEGKGSDSGLADALRNKSVTIFETLNFFYKVYTDKKADGTLPQYAIALVTALEQAVTPAWEVFLSNADEVQNVSDMNDLTEPFRRVPGFLAMVKGMVLPLLAPAKEEEAAITAVEHARLVLAKLLHHLHCHENFYVQKFLSYMEDKTRHKAIVDFVERVIDALNISADAKEDLRRQFDVERAFVDRQEIIVPAWLPLDAADIAALDSALGGKQSAGSTPTTPPPPVRVVDVEVPADGIHLEAAEGNCILENLPPEPGPTPEPPGA